MSVLHKKKQQKSYTKCNRCLCDSCSFWRQFNRNVENTSLFYIYCNLLDHSLTKNEFYTDDNLWGNSEVLTNRSEMFPVMIDYEDITVDFCDSIEDVYFHKNVKLSLSKLGIKSMWQLQRYTWPILIRMQHLVIVGDAYTGKTFAYLPSVLSLILDLDEELDNDLNKMQPRVIVICSSSREVFQLCKFISGFCIKGLKFTYILSSLMLHLPSGSDYKCYRLIVGTPEAFQEAIDMDLIDFRFVFSCVFETWNFFEDNQIQICMDLMENIKKDISKTENVNPLMIAVTEIWTDSLKEFTKKYFTNLPVYCIQSAIETCMYAGHKFYLTMLNETRKMNYVLEIVKKLKKSEKIVIISESEEELISLSEYLIHFDIFFYLLGNNTDNEEVQIIKKNWNVNMYKNSILLINDKMLRVTNIQNATILIHLSIPTLWVTLQYRFTSLIKNSHIRSMLNKQCKIYIIINENSIKQMYSLSSLLNRLNFDEYCKDYRIMYENIMETNEKMKCMSSDQYQMCSSLISFGECFEYTEYNMCKRCHLFQNDVNVLNLPDSGMIEFCLLKIRSPTRFFVKLINSDGDINYIRENFNKVQKELKNFEQKFKNESIRQLDKNARVQVGEIYGYGLCKEKFIARVKILAIGFESVDIISIDKGNELYNVPINDLFYLSEALERLPCCIVEVNLCNLVPYHLSSEKSYCLHCTYLLIRMLQKCSSVEKFRGRIVLRYQSIYWLDDFEMIGNENEKKLSIREYLIENKIAKNDENVLKKILQNINEAAVDDNEKKNELETRMMKWMELSSDMFDRTKVDVTHMIDISEFYVIVNSEKKSIEELEAKLKVLYPKMVQDKTKVNNFYAVLMKNGNVKRALVLSIQENIAECFLVDSGITVFLDINYLRVLDKNCIEELSFQAIKCRLWGVTKKLFRDCTNIFERILEMKTFSAFNYVMKEHNCLLHMKLHGVLLVTKDMTLNSWLVKEFPNDFQLNPDESFMDFLENDNNDEDDSNLIKDQVACLSMKENEEMKLIETIDDIDLLENCSDNSSSVSEYNSIDFKI